MRTSLIVAMTPDRLIGRHGDLPWRLSDDLRRFKQLTIGHTIVMGRRTYESIGRPLPGRTTIVLSRTQEARRVSEKNAPHTPPPRGPVEFPVSVAHDFESAVAMAAVANETELFIVGGSQVYELALPFADRVYLTEVYASLDGDTYFPEWNRSEWRLIKTEATVADERNQFPTQFQIWDRKAPSPS